MYEIFDEALKNTNLKFTSNLFGDSKMYFLKCSKKYNFTIFIVVEKKSFHHQVIYRFTKIINPSKRLEYLELANELTKYYNDISCMINDDYSFEVKRWYTARENQFDSHLFFILINQLVDILDKDIIPKVIKINSMEK